MKVPENVREAESEIDEAIRQHSLFEHDRTVALEALMEWYRDQVELAGLLLANGELFDTHHDWAGLETEGLVRRGLLWCLKWVYMNCPTAGGLTNQPDPERIQELVFEANSYQALVDGLKGVHHDYCSVECDPARRTLTFREGGNQSGWDPQIVGTQRWTSPRTRQFVLTEDSDQITTGWSAGAYRRFMEQLAAVAEGAERETIVADMTPLGGELHDLFKRPHVCRLSRAQLHAHAGILAAAVMNETNAKLYRWTQDSILETPLIELGSEYLFLSHDVRALRGHDDYMLRLANRVDPEAYSRVSGLREDRMLEFVTRAFRNNGWSVKTRHLLKSPEQELDVVATHTDHPRLILQLKSTLRPESPWETKKRNDELLAGINHTSSALTRFWQAIGFVVTDGYRGDYQVWGRAIETGVHVLTLADLDALATDPSTAHKLAAEQVGIREPSGPNSPSQNNALADREGTIRGWTITLKDE